MYLRPGNLLKEFWVETDETKLSSRGRVGSRYHTEQAVKFSGVLAEAKPEERDRWQQIGHPVSHVITQRGKAIAKVGNRLIHGSRCFYIQGVDDVGELGIATIYYAEERTDIHGYADTGIQSVSGRPGC